ncbi:DNA-binding MarR family transcriptional regulator [Okibacterium sp. HSC-33S16]|uniref:MarR family winged helix-turn-helix transcriptional regulator n=1 Tax=Okibacterium sp. HSC-33S16 TaxID=2910965 RepID=UPI00209CAEE2|nr:MarR family transcriptional regulator [Okibacterium sp. HSC-33S16]MCP2032297.1 DNA-binding MarR family transcriptional regulator [Okibacterium sp. HSC-33S16]
MTETLDIQAPDAVASAPLHSLLGDLITTAHRLTRLAAHETNRTESPATWRTLSVLQAHGPMRLGELARQSRVTQPTMTKIVRGLDELNWIKRIADSDDARASLIASMPRGEAALAEWRETLGTALVPFFDGLTDDEQDTLRRAVDILRDRADLRSSAPSAGAAK